MAGAGALDRRGEVVGPAEDRERPRPGAARCGAAGRRRGTRPDAGRSAARSSSRLTRCSPTTPAPTISVGVANASVRTACRRIESSTTARKRRGTRPRTATAGAREPTGCVAAERSSRGAIVSIARATRRPSTCVVGVEQRAVQPVVRARAARAGSRARSAGRLPRASGWRFARRGGAANRAALDARYSTTTSTSSRSRDHERGRAGAPARESIRPARWPSAMPCLGDRVAAAGGGVIQLMRRRWNCRSRHFPATNNTRLCAPATPHALGCARSSLEPLVVIIQKFSARKLGKTCCRVDPFDPADPPTAPTPVIGNRP